MSVYLYLGGMKIVQRSGIWQAVSHQREALAAAGVSMVQRLDKEACIVHINTIFPDSLITAVLARKRGAKVVYYAHSTMEDFQRSFRGSNLLAPLFKKWIMFCYERGDIILTPTEYSRRILKGYGISRPIYSISNGIDAKRFAPDLERGNSFRRRYQLTSDDKVVISVGHMIERKGILDYIELARRMPDVNFFWFGYTQPALIPRAVHKAIKSAPENLKFAGYVNQEQLQDAYCGADVFAFLSKEETEGIVVLEALACETPAVVRDIPVYDGWLVDGENVYKASTTEGFKQVISGILDKTLPDISAAGRRTAKERDFKAIGERLREIYAEEMFAGEDENSNSLQTLVE